MNFFMLVPLCGRGGGGPVGVIVICGGGGDLGVRGELATMVRYGLFYSLHDASNGN